MRESEFVRKSREKSGLSQLDVAEVMGYTSGQFISNIERGICELPAENVRHFCEITNASPRTYLRIKVEAERKRLRRAIYS